VRVVKTWSTCNDDFCCPVCAALNGKIVEIDDYFAPGVFHPPGVMIAVAGWAQQQTYWGKWVNKQRVLYLLHR
jgi:hypothetical protein